MLNNVPTSGGSDVNGCAFLLQVFGAIAEAHTCDLDSYSQLAAQILFQRKYLGRCGVRLQCGHHAPSPGFVSWIFEYNP